MYATAVYHSVPPQKKIKIRPLKKRKAKTCNKGAILTLPAELWNGRNVEMQCAIRNLFPFSTVSIIVQKVSYLWPMTTLRTDSTHSGITIDYADGSAFVHGGSGPLTVYSDDEKAAINALTDANDDTYYLFLVSSVTKLDADGNNTVVSGYMPVGYQHGFIFEQFDVARTFAHELSHGAFALHHTFSANTESFRADEGTTTNLMDYTQSGITLNHKQWTWMHEKHGSGLFGFLADEDEGEQKIKENPLQKMGIVYMTEKWEDGVTYSSEELPKPPTFLNGIASATLRNAINKYVSKTESFKSIIELLSTKQNVLRIIDRNTIQNQRGSTNIFGCDKKTKIVSSIEKKESDMLAVPDDYYLIDRIYIYTESFKELPDNESMLLMAIVLGHELFIHYNHIKAISLWQQGKYKEALDVATKNTGPNHGDYDHSDYINENKKDEGTAFMYKYLDELQNVIKLENSSVTQTDFNKAKEEHDNSYKRLIERK